MKLKITKRNVDKKSEKNKIRREGGVPICLYSKGEKAENFSVNRAEFENVLRHVKQGRLPTTVLTLVDENNKERKCIVKDIQYNITNYNVIHLDLEELHDDIPINIKVPIECIGVVDCVGIKLGGVLRQVIRHVKVQCLPKDIPGYFELDVSKLAQRQSKRLSDIVFPENLRPLANLKEVAVAIVKR